MASGFYLFPFSNCEISMFAMVVIVLLYGCCILTFWGLLNVSEGVKEWWTKKSNSLPMVISYNFIYDRYFSYYYLTELESWGSDREP